MPVNCVGVKQVRTHRHANVGQRQEEFIILVNHNGWRRRIGRQHALLHDPTRVEATLLRRRGADARERHSGKAEDVLRIAVSHGHHAITGHEVIALDCGIACSWVQRRGLRTLHVDAAVLSTCRI